MSLASTFANLASSVPSRVLASLGMGFVSMAGYQLLMTELIGMIQDKWSSAGANFIAYASIGGFTTGIGIILGSVVASIAITSLPKLSRLASV